MTGTHPRNTQPMLSSPRCGAKTRSAGLARLPRFAARGGAACMAVHGVLVLQWATKMLCVLAGIRGRSSGGARRSAICCGNRANSFV